MTVATPPAAARAYHGCIGFVIGASRYPAMPAVDEPRLEQPFLRAAQAAAGYLASFCSEIVNLFDCEASAAEVVDRIRTAIRTHATASDLIVYYVGHGSFTSRQEYFLCLRSTEVDAKANTGLLVNQLADALRTFVRVKKKRVHLLLDCCFAGAAMTSFLQAPSGHLRRLRLAGLRLPAGFALLCAASRDDAAVVPEGDSLPLFSGALFEVIERGIGDRDRMTLREALSAIDEIIVSRGKDDTLRPELHLSNPKATNVADLPLFPVRRNPSASLLRIASGQRAALDRVYDMSAVRKKSMWRVAILWAALPAASGALLWFILSSSLLESWREYYACWHGQPPGKGRACVNYANRFFWKAQYSEAKQYYHFSCDLRDGLGCAYLGMVYEEGRGVPPDQGAAVALYKLSCDTLKEQQGCARLGSCYARGACNLAADETKARALLSTACDTGEVQGCDYLKRYKLNHQ